jgi:hypothetical protein
MMTRLGPSAKYVRLERINKNTEVIKEYNTAEKSIAE